ncbi:MAG TPA: response regulator [Chitinophagales bacterium]|nr:response regulator [Chitinophagales bacterium]HMX04596.1 response regulator [Chitinophagales bacterium]HMZ89034.1 response regulator [Chitinophagales bacterium]HNE45463.1 response regulator [Chitinophagales bacterium]HNF68090.1 response regulator [Chitinophagales bacterium]
MENRKQTTILLIEDNPADARLVEIYLNESAMIQPQISRVSELGKGMLMLEERDFDIVLLDLTLPDSSGFETVKTILREFPGQTVIVMTGLEDDTVAINSVKAGAQDFIVKGQFDSNLLGRTITYAIERHRLQIKLEDYAKAIKLNEQRLTEAQKLAQMGNWELDVVNNQMYWSDEVYRILGYKQGQLEPTLADYLKPIADDDVEEVKAILNRTLEKGQPFHAEYKVKGPGNSTKKVSIQGLVQKSKINGGLCLAGTIQDITNLSLAKSEGIDKQALMSVLKNAIAEADNSGASASLKKLLESGLNMIK